MRVGFIVVARILIEEELSTAEDLIPKPFEGVVEGFEVRAAWRLVRLQVYRGVALARGGRQPLGEVQHFLAHALLVVLDVLHELHLLLKLPFEVLGLRALMLDLLEVLECSFPVL